MNEIDNKTKEILVRLIEYLFENIDGRFLNFSTQYKMTHTTKYGSEPEKKWTEIIYPVFVQTKYGDVTLNLSSLHLGTIENAIWKACNDFIYNGIISEKEREDILLKLHSDNFLELGKEINPYQIQK